VYVEWDQGIFTTEGDDAGEAQYSLEGTPYTFQVQARGSPDFHLQVVLDGISTVGNPQGSIIPLGWKHDGIVEWFLSGKVGHFSSSNPPASWMQANLSMIGDRALRHLCMPGSHDAGMSVLHASTAFVGERNVLTQKVSIGDQLVLGARYFDCRPVISSGQFVSGHYSDLGDPLGWQGKLVSAYPS
jgi:hypothetical protein